MRLLSSLDAPSHLDKRVCPSVHWAVTPFHKCMPGAQSSQYWPYCRISGMILFPFISIFLGSLTDSIIVFIHVSTRASLTVLAEQASKSKVTGHKPLCFILPGDWHYSPMLLREPLGWLWVWQRRTSWAFEEKSCVTPSFCVYAPILIQLTYLGCTGEQ